MLNAKSVAVIVTTLGPAGRGGCCVHAAAAARLASARRRRGMRTPYGSGSLEQDDPRHAAGIVAVWLGGQLPHQIPQPGERAGPLQPQRLFPPWTGPRPP